MENSIILNNKVAHKNNIIVDIRDGDSTHVVYRKITLQTNWLSVISKRTPQFILKFCRRFCIMNATNNLYKLLYYLLNIFFSVEIVSLSHILQRRYLEILLVQLTLVIWRETARVESLVKDSWMSDQVFHLS